MFCKRGCNIPVLLEENIEAVQVFNYIVAFAGEGLELPACLPWLLETLDVVEERETLDKILILQGILKKKKWQQTH